MEEVKSNYESELQKNNDKVKKDFKLWDFETLIFDIACSSTLIQSRHIGLILSSAPPSSGVLPAGETPQHQPGLSELQWAEPSAAAFSPAAADHADWEHCPHLWTGGEPEPAAETGRIERHKSFLIYQGKWTSWYDLTVEYYWMNLVFKGLYNST